MASNAFPRPLPALKRKLIDPTGLVSRTAPHKALKHSADDSPRRPSNGEAVNGFKSAQVQDEEEADPSDQEAGPDLPPPDLVDDKPEDDEEGRFYGGGVTKKENDVLDYIDRNDEDAPDEQINLAWLKRTALSFERKINKNAELRAKYEDEPMKFVSSEADLDSEIKGLSLLSDHPELYADFVRSGCSDSLVGLLAHDNTDIAIAASEIIADLIDEDSAVPAEDWSKLVTSMLNADLIGLLVSNLNRLDESLETDNAGVYHILNVLENLLSDPSNAENLGRHPNWFKWLLQRLKRVDQSAPNHVGQNRQYAAELLVILTQNNPHNAAQLVQMDAVDVLLNLLNTWTRRDPEKDTNEEEFAENLFDCLVTLVKVDAGREKLIENEGIELCLIMLKEGKFSKRGALRVLDHAAAGFTGGPICVCLVEAGGLKHLFTTLMKNKRLEKESIEHLLGVLSSLLRLLPAGSATRVRALAKFVENDYEKCSKILELRKAYAERLSTLDRQIVQERKSMGQEEIDASEDDWLSRRMDAGLFPLQSLDVILAWLMAEDRGTRQHLVKKLDDDDGGGLTAVRRNLEEQLKVIESEEADDAVLTRDMLKSLIDLLP